MNTGQTNYIYVNIIHVFIVNEVTSSRYILILDVAQKGNNEKKPEWYQEKEKNDYNTWVKAGERK